MLINMCGCGDSATHWHSSFYVSSIQIKHDICKCILHHFAQSLVFRINYVYVCAFCK